MKSCLRGISLCGLVVLFLPLGGGTARPHGGMQASGDAETIPRFGMLERTFSSATTPANPYVTITATAILTEPDGRTQRHLPLFWDGGSRWTFRFSPDRVGSWQWTIRSDDSGLVGRSGAFGVVPSDGAGGIMPMEGFPRHFQRQNGEPFWFQGETAWALYTDSAEEQHDGRAAEQQIDTRAAQDFNVMHSMLISEGGWGNEGGDAFEDLSRERLNPAYWQAIDRRLAYLNRKGITGGLVLAWGDKRRNPNDWREFPSQPARLRYARYVTARYSAYDVYFIVAGEWNNDVRNSRSLTAEEVRAQYGEIGAAIQGSDPHGRMITIHPGGNPGTVRSFAAEPWMSFGDYQQQYTRLHQSILESRDAGKPVINSEYAYYLRDQNEDGRTDKNNSADLAMIRHATWDIVMAGDGSAYMTGSVITVDGGHTLPLVG